MAITRATGFPVNQTTAATAPPATWVTVGDLAVIAMGSFAASGDTVSAISSTKATGWAQVIDAADASDNFSISIWTAKITATGADTITVSWAGATPSAGNFECVTDELVSGLGSTNVWSTVASGSLRDTVSPWNFPSLNSNAVALQAYWGYGLFATAFAGATTGYTYTITGTNNLVAFNGGLAANTAAQPAASTSSSGPAWTAAGIISAALPAAALPDLIMAPMRGNY